MAEGTVSRPRQRPKGLALTPSLAMLSDHGRHRGLTPCWYIQSKLGVAYFQPGKFHLPFNQDNACSLRLRLSIARRHGRPPGGGAWSPFFPRSVGLRPTVSHASGALSIAPSTLCQSQAMPSMSSYSVNPALQRSAKARSHPPFEVGVNSAGTAEPLFGKHLPLAACMECVNNGFKDPP